jgi:outer membrane protein assembly factor BamB/tetratricopeptide (TPR) repeat protein
VRALLGACLVIGWLGAFARPAFAQFANRSSSRFDPDTSPTPAENKLRNAASHARERQWSEAVAIYQGVIDEFGDKVVKLPASLADPSGEIVLYVVGRRYCHRALAQLPPEAREIYRNRVDGMAERWFRQGARDRNVRLLHRVVDQTFCSSWGDDALELLGDLAFQDGRFGDALASYDRLVADHPDDPLVLVHPDPSVDLARIAAKKLLCRAALGEYPPLPEDLAEFGRRFPGAAGSVAGRTGTYAQILAEALASDHLAPTTQPDSRWPTFAGSLRRSKVVPGPIDAGSLQWRVDLEKVALNRAGPFGSRAGMMGGATPAEPDRLLAYHPIILGDQVIVCDGSRILAFDLNDRPADADGGPSRPVEPTWRYPPDDDNQATQGRQPHFGIPRYTLTAFGDRIYARMGTNSPAYFSSMGGSTGRGVTSIVALDWNTQGKLLWEQKSIALVLPNRAPDHNNRSVSFEGAPVADARGVYVAVTDRRERTATYVACFDAETGASRWIRYLGSASPELDNNAFGFGMGFPQSGMIAAGDFNHRLLSLDGPALYYQTNLGAVVALEAETGATLWVATYPRQEPNQSGSGSDRDLNPAVVDNGRVFVAPSDADALFAFDAGSGRLLWKVDQIPGQVKLAHLLGVAKDRLVATGDRVLLFDVKDGRLKHVWPDSGKSLDGYGRGLLAGDRIYWPTQNEIQVLDQRTGILAAPPIKLLQTYHTKGGNLVAGDGYLIVAQADGLVVFCQNSLLIERYRQEIARAPEHAGNYFRLARAAEAIGRDPLALEMYGKAAQKARANDLFDGVSLSGVARDHQFRLLFRLARDARKTRRWEDAVAYLASAGAVARSSAERLQTQLLLSDVLLEAGQARRAVEICQQLLADERLRPLAVPAADGHRTVRADLLIAGRLSSIVRAHGPGVYEPFDREAARLFERTLSQRDPRGLAELCRLYPEARVVPEALLELGSLYEGSRRYSDAAGAYRQLLAVAHDDERRAFALLRLARVHEARSLFVSARETFLKLQARYPTVHLKEGGREETVASLVAAELSRPLYTQQNAERARPPMPLPLVRRWHAPAPAGQPIRVLSACGIAPAVDASRFFQVEKSGMRVIDPSTGVSRWSAELGGPAVWAGYLSDRLIAATTRQIVALDLTQGTVQWRYDAARSGKDQSPLDPFADAGPASAHERGDRTSDTLSGFLLSSGRVFCLRGHRELIALDGDTGLLDWSFASGPGEINANLWIGSERTVVQVDRPNQLLVLQTRDGELLRRVALAENDLLWRPPIPVDEDSVLLVPDRRTVKRFDINSGNVIWAFQESADLPVYGPPRVLAKAQHLLVLHDGRLLIRLDPATGSKRWSCLLGTEDLSERPDSMACDEKNFYCVNIEHIYGSLRQAICAVSLEDGTRLWSCPRPGPEDVLWSIALTDRCVIAYPNSTRGAEENSPGSMPVVIRRRETGALVQRFVFQTAVGDVLFKADSRGALLATARGIWGLGPKEGGQSTQSDRPR